MARIGNSFAAIAPLNFGLSIRNACFDRAALFFIRAIRVIRG